MSNLTAFCIMYIIVASMLHLQFRPMLLEKRQLLIVAFMDTFVAVSIGVATNALFAP